FNLLIEQLELDQQDRRLQRVQPAVHAQLQVTVAPSVAVIDQTTQRRRQVVIIGKQRSAVAVGPQRLAGKEAGTGDPAQAAGSAPVAAGPKALSGILDHCQTMALGYRLY